jgi:hypothetical protein
MSAPSVIRDFSTARGQFMKSGVSDNVGGVKRFLSVLLLALLQFV